MGRSPSDKNCSRPGGSGVVAVGCIGARKKFPAKNGCGQSGCTAANQSGNRPTEALGTFNMCSKKCGTWGKPCLLRAVFKLGRQVGLIHTLWIRRQRDCRQDSGIHGAMPNEPMVNRSWLLHKLEGAR